MSSTQPTLGQGVSTKSNESAQQIESVAWAIFFIWVGVTILAQVPWEWFLLGVGALILAAQLARWLMDVETEGFWIACGIVFLAGGLWTLLAIPWPLVPILLILFGLALLGKAGMRLTR